MGKITREQFLQDVRTEVESLKVHATKSEIAELDIKTFNPMKKHLCIYGQMTGSCESKRAKELMDKACVRVTNSDGDAFVWEKFDKVADKINGEYTGQTWEKATVSRRAYTYLSMVEAYIFLDGSSPANIIDYLNGDVETLELPLD